MSESIFTDGILKGHVAFVTGGGTGITGGVARAFAEAGASRRTGEPKDGTLATCG